LDNKLTLAIMAPRERMEHLTVINCGFLNLVLTTDPISLQPGHQDRHTQYEFLIPLSYLPKLFVEDLEIDCHPGHLIPINPGQRHGVKRGHDPVSYILVFIEQGSMDRIIRQISGISIPSGFPVDSLPLKTDIQLLISRLIHENRENETGREMLMLCLAEELGVMLVRHYYRFSAQLEIIPPEKLIGDQLRFQDTISHMQAHYRDRLSIENLSGLSGMNSYHFIRTFKRAFNVSPYNYLTRIRIANAKRMLVQTNLSTSEIGKMCGFQSASRFSAVLQKESGLTPSRYRKLNSEAKL